MKKYVISACFTVLLMALLCSAALAAGGTHVVLEGKVLETQAKIDGHSVLLPVRAVCEALGYEVTWSKSGGIATVMIQKDSDSVLLDLTHQSVTDNGHTYPADVYSGGKMMLLAGRTYMDTGLFTSIFPVSATYDSKTSQVLMKIIRENNMTITTEKITSEKDYLNVRIQYPQLTGLDGKIQDNINALLYSAAQNALKEGENNASDMAQAVKDGYTGAVGRCETYYDYKIAYNKNGLLSVVLVDYQYAGGAHGLTIQRAYTFDLSTGEPLGLADFFISGGGYKAAINAAVRKEIDSRTAAGELDEFEFSKFSDIGENAEYYLSDNGFVIYFQEYAYFPYAAGIQEFNMSYADLAAMLNDAHKFLSATPVSSDSNT